MLEHDHAIVIGGSVAGLLSARVAAQYYRQVTIIERDVIDGVSGARKSAPQGHHIHALLARGQQILEGLFPGLTESLGAEGVPVGDFGTSLRWFFDGHMMRQSTTDLTCVAADRPLLERRIRERVLTMSNVRLCEQTEVTGILADRCSTQVHGVELHNADRGTTRLDSDLIIDAAGRATRMPAWLESLGYGRVPEERIKMDLVYTTQDYYPPMPVDVLGEEIAWLPVATPSSPRGAIFARLRDRYAISLTGLGGDTPPRDPKALLGYVASLPVKGIYESVASAEPMGPAHSFRFPASVRRRYDKMKSLPAGLLSLGDALSNFNPVYGQGMTVAAIASESLDRHLNRDSIEPHAYMVDMSKCADTPWSMAAGADLAYPGVQGARTISTRLGNGYISRLQRAAVKDPELSRAFLRVAGLVDSPSSLFHPRIVGRVLSGA